MTIRAIPGLLAVLLLAACGKAASVDSPSAPSATAPIADRTYVLGAIWVSEGTAKVELAKLHPLTLEPLGRRIELDGPGFTTSWSPDRKTLILAGGEHARIDVVDVERMVLRGSIQLGMEGYVGTLAWRKDGTVLATVEGRESAVVAVDLRARRIVETHPVDGTLLAARRVGDAIYALVSPRDRIGPLKLTLFPSKGSVVVELDGITGGWESEGEGEEIRLRQRIPGFTVDPAGRRAVVVPAGRTVAEVRLNDLSVTYRTLSQPVSLWGRVRNWLEPTAEAKSIEGPGRTAHWIGGDLVAVAGVDYEARSEDESEESPATPAGLAFLDTREWKLRTVDDKVGEIRVAGRTLLALEWWCAGDEASFGLAAYDSTGEERFRLCRPTGFDVQTVGRYAYLAFSGERRFEVIDLRTGRVVAVATTPKTITLLPEP